MTAWFVASVEVRREKDRLRHPTRTWCFFMTKEEAFMYVERCAWLLNDGGWYNYAVVEAHGDGELPIAIEEPGEEHWFELSGLGKVIKATACEKPAEFRNTVNFAIG